MASSSRPSLIARAINALFAVAFAVAVLAAYWPTVQVLGLWRADLGYQGVWLEGYSKKITSVAPGGVADRDGLRVGDVLQFDPRKHAHWVLAGYRQMPAGFAASIPVRRMNGAVDVVTLAPERVAYLPTLNDRMAYLARLLGFSVMILLGVFMVCARPGLMTWSLLLAYASPASMYMWGVYYLAFVASQPGLHLLEIAPMLTATFLVAFVPFSMSFPRDSMPGWPSWKLALGLLSAGAFLAWVNLRNAFAPFELDTPQVGPMLILAAAGVVAIGAAIAALALTYRRADGNVQARLRWALLGMSASLGMSIIAFASVLVPVWLSAPRAGSSLTPANWVYAICSGILFPLAFGVAVFRQRVVDIQFAVSRTLVYGAVSTLALVFIATVHWLLGRLIEQSHFTLGLEAVAAIGLGLVLHRATHGINLLVDKVLFRKHHQAEQRLRRVTAALPFATGERAIADALVMQPVHNLHLASAALFYRDTPDGPLRRVLAHGWDAQHAASLDPDSLLVRCLQAECAPVRLDDPNLVPGDSPHAEACPVLAVPITNQHQLLAVTLYGAHLNSTLPDPDEVELLHALAKAAAVSHQQVRIATLTRRNEQLEASAAELRSLVRAGLLGQEIRVRADPA